MQVSSQCFGRITATAERRAEKSSEHAGAIELYRLTQENILKQDIE